MIALTKQGFITPTSVPITLFQYPWLAKSQGLCRPRKVTNNNHVCTRLNRPNLRMSEFEPLLSSSSTPSSSTSLPTVPLIPPNEEVDWVIVDALAEDDLPDYASNEQFLHEVQDDAKSLLRVLLRDASVEMSVVVCTDAHIKSLNHQWRNVDAATDVLSFPQSDPDQVVLGDIVISVETAAVQAKERAITLRDEIRILLVHGVLHLLGYDHEGEKEGDWLVMAQMENRLMKQLDWKGEGLVSAAQDPLYREIIQQ